MRTLSCVVSAFLSSVCLCASAADAGASFPAEEARRLVRQLGDLDAEKRRAASDRLFRLCDAHPEDLLPLLPEDDPDMAIQVVCDDLRTRAREWIAVRATTDRIPAWKEWLKGDIDFARAAAALLPEPNPATMHALFSAGGKPRPYEGAQILAALLPEPWPTDTTCDLLGWIALANGGGNIVGDMVEEPMKNGMGTVSFRPVLGRFGLTEEEKEGLIPRVVPFLSHANDQVRQAAARALCLLEATEQAGAILGIVRERKAYMRDQDMARGIELARLGPEALRPHLPTLLKDGNWRVRAAAIEAIGHAYPGDTAWLPTVELFIEDPVVNVRIRAFYAVIALHGGLGSHEARRKSFPWLAARILDDVNDGFYIDHMMPVFTALPFEELDRTLTAWLDDPRLWVRHRAVALFGEDRRASLACHPEVIRAIERLLPEELARLGEDPRDLDAQKLVIQAIFRLGRVGNRGSVPKLARFLDDPDPYVQRQAAISIGLLVDGHWVEAKTRPIKGMDNESVLKRGELEMKYKDGARHAREWWEANKRMFEEGEKVKGR